MTCNNCDSLIAFKRSTYVKYWYNDIMRTFKNVIIKNTKCTCIIERYDHITNYLKKNIILDIYSITEKQLFLKKNQVEQISLILLSVFYIQNETIKYPDPYSDDVIFACLLLKQFNAVELTSPLHFLSSSYFNEYIWEMKGSELNNIINSDFFFQILSKSDNKHLLMGIQILNEKNLELSGNILNLINSTLDSDNVDKISKLNLLNEIEISSWITNNFQLNEILDNYNKIAEILVRKNQNVNEIILDYLQKSSTVETFYLVLVTKQDAFDTFLSFINNKNIYINSSHNKIKDYIQYLFLNHLTESIFDTYSIYFDDEETYKLILKLFNPKFDYYHKINTYPLDKVKTFLIYYYIPEIKDLIVLENKFLQFDDEQAIIKLSEGFHDYNAINNSTLIYVNLTATITEILHKLTERITSKLWADLNFFMRELIRRIPDFPKLLQIKDDHTFNILAFLLKISKSTHIIPFQDNIQDLLKESVSFNEKYNTPSKVYEIIQNELPDYKKLIKTFNYQQYISMYMNDIDIIKNKHLLLVLEYYDQEHDIDVEFINKIRSIENRKELSNYFPQKDLRIIVFYGLLLDLGTVGSYSYWFQFVNDLGLDQEKKIRNELEQIIENYHLLLDQQNTLINNLHSTLIINRKQIKLIYELKNLTNLENIKIRKLLKIAHIEHQEIKAVWNSVLIYQWFDNRVKFILDPNNIEQQKTLIKDLIKLEKQNVINLKSFIDTNVLLDFINDHEFLKDILEINETYIFKKIKFKLEIENLEILLS